MVDRCEEVEEMDFMKMILYCRGEDGDMVTIVLLFIW